LFNWNNVKKNEIEKNKLKEYLKIKGLDWLEDPGFTIEDEHTKKIVGEKPDHILLIKLNDEETFATVMNVHTGKLICELVIKKETNQTNIYYYDKSQKGDENILFQQSLRDITLIFLSPILAIAVWLLLKQGGLSQTGVYTFALISLTVGLVTDDVIRFLEEYARKLSASDKGKDTVDKNIRA
jgi:hypothetical protein